MSKSIDGCKKLDEYILRICKNNNLPIFCWMGVGYSKEIKHIVNAHVNIYKIANEIFF